MAKFPVSLKARLLLQDAGRVLLLKQTTRNGGNYSLIGGTVEKSEYAIDTLIRESREESGIELTPADLQLVHTLHKRYRRSHRIVLYFKAYHYAGEPQSLEPRKFENVEWHPMNDLPPNLSPTVAHVLAAYRQGQLFSTMQK